VIGEEETNYTGKGEGQAADKRHKLLYQPGRGEGKPCRTKKGEDPLTFMLRGRITRPRAETRRSEKDPGGSNSYLSHTKS